jgi:hypothetical protein
MYFLCTKQTPIIMVPWSLRPRRLPIAEYWRHRRRLPVAVEVAVEVAAAAAAAAATKIRSHTYHRLRHLFHPPYHWGPRVDCGLGRSRSRW